jgi:hypothetical protein
MKKSTVAAIAAASLLGFGAVGSAMADTQVSGFEDIQYNAYNSGLATPAESGNFRASGEVDLIEKGDGITFRTDLDILNALNTSPPVDVPSGTGGLGVDVEQLFVNIPVMDMASLKAGIFNSPFGLEGQDATDLKFAANGLLWQAVPSNIVGAMVNVAPTDMLSINVGYINSRANASGAAGLGDVANDWVATVAVKPMAGIGVNLGYITDDGNTGSVKSYYGNQFDINASIDMVPNLDVTLDYMMGDPATGTGAFDNGYGANVSYTMAKVTGAVRYEAASYEGAANDVTATSGSVSYQLAEQSLVRLDWTNVTVDKGPSSDTGTIQMVHTF